MADNTVLDAGTGGDTIATDDIGGVKFQRVKITTGADGTANDVTNANPVPVSDAGGSLTVDGTVAVSGTVTVAAHAVTNAGTFATQVDGAALTALQLIDNIVVAEDVAASGGESGVPVLAVRRDSASSGVSADGDFANLSVDSTGALRVTGGGGGTQYAEDTAHVGGDVGNQVLAVRRDADTTLVGTDGDYAPLQVNSTGSLKVAITAGAGSGGTSIADGASFTRNTTSLTPVGGVVEAAAPTVVAGDAVALSLTTGGAVRVDVASGGITGRAEDSAASGGEDGVPFLAVRRDAASSGVGSDGDWANLSVDSNGALRVTGSTGTTQYAEDVAHTTGDSLVALGAVRRDTAAVGSGTDGDYSTVNVDASGRVWVNASGAAVPVTDNAGSLTVDNGGTFATQATQAGTWTVQPGNTPNTAPWLTALRSGTTGGLSAFRSIDLDETEEEIKATAGQVYGWYLYNTSASVRFVKFYNATAASVTVGSTAPVLTIPVPATSGANVFSDIGIAFSTAITVAATTGVADADAGAPAANDVVVNVFYT
jgi:hypothetical protein